MNTAATADRSNVRFVEVTGDFGAVAATRPLPAPSVGLKRPLWAETSHQKAMRLRQLCPQSGHSRRVRRRSSSSPKQKRHAIKQKNLLAPKISGQQSYSISEDRAQRLISSSELTSSILASSASVNSKFWTAPTQSTICSGREAPIRAVVIRSPLSTQASAI